MSLPIAKQPGQEAAPLPGGPPFARPRANTLQSTVMGSDGDDQARRKRVRLNPLQTNNVSSYPVHSPPDQGAFLPPGYISSLGPPSWQQTPQPPQMSSFHGFPHQYNQLYSQRRQELFPLHTAVEGSFSGLPWSQSPISSAQSGSSAGVFDNMSPFSNYPRAPGSGQFQDPFVPQGQFENPSQSNPRLANHTQQVQSPPQATLPPDLQLGSSSHQVKEIESSQQQSTSQEITSVKQEPSIERPVTRPTLKRTRSAPEVAVTDNEDDDLSNGYSNAVVPFQPMLNLGTPSVSNRMRELLGYYDRSICPVLVTFDDDHNPYRKHIMHLAMNNSGLQNALGALVTNNMRMRKLQQVPSLTNGTHKDIISKAIGAPNPEEQHYKAKSIDYLNSQLADPSKAMDDSVLATLLILCLFHVCDSGFSKFKTQLAGVQKLLKMRSGIPRSEFHGWVEMFFAWFDVMTSAVNDRETQIQGQILDLMDLTNDLGSVEVFSGCDGKLFKLIARLGRLNLLSQQKPVKELKESPTTNNFQGSFPDLNFLNDVFAMPSGQIDMNNGSSDFAVQEVPELERGPQQDPRQQFWMEWHDLHERLHTWQNSQLEGMSLDSNNVSVGQRAMLHMSESFRWAALLYLERLANPMIPSESENLQDLVRKSLYHIKAIGTNSCVTKFMLWPLFISGTECVDSEHRDLIRDRCIEIQQESGFYNNISGLEVLERVWKESDEDVSFERPMSNACSHQAFRWRNCMDRVDGEYIVI